MKKYEGLFIFPPEASTQDAKGQAHEIEEWIKKFKGKVLEKNDLGKKTLGYSIRKYHEGKMHTVIFEMDPGQVESFRKTLELKETLLKYTLFVFEERSKKNYPVSSGQKNLSQR